MHLRDGRSREGLFVELDEQALEALPEIFGHDVLYDREWFWWDLVAAFAELFDELGREEPIAAGDDLAELDVGRAEPFGRAS